MKKAVVLVSGGMDSAVLLWSLMKSEFAVYTLSVHYGQRHFRELRSAHQLCEVAKAAHHVVDLREINSVLGGSSQTDLRIPVPEGHYEDPVMRLTVVPNRNMILLSVAAACAISQGAQYVAYAAHTGDHAVYPDCRPEFVKALQSALHLCHYDGGIQLLAPFTSMSKAQLVTLGASLGVPFEYTWSCYNPTAEGEHCGRCGTCVERRLAFVEAKVTDPTAYACPLEDTQALAATH